MRKDALRSGHLQQAPIAVPFACGIFFIVFKLKSIKKFKQENELLQIIYSWMKRFCLPQCRIEVYQIIKYTITRLPLPIHVSIEGEFYLWFNFILLSFSVRY